jgi:bifunctional non-homologous end joining protein LigD
VRDLLARAGLKSFVRTTGGKGLHVVVPLRPAASWDKAKKFAHALAESFAAVRPGEFVAVANKQRRDGRIFVDYLRNTRGATSVASYSLRARPGAPVALPLRWSELKTLKGGDAFTIRNVPARLKRMRSDPWAGYESVGQDLDSVADLPGK